MPVDPILTNRLYLDLAAETAWGDAGAGSLSTTPAATQLDLNAVADGTLMTGILQPKGQRKITITVTDANAGINAFSITIVGKDRFGAALTQTFLFAGGLVQTSTAYYATLTSITVDSIVGESAGDTLDAHFGDVLGILIPILDGDYGVGLEDPSREQQHVVGNVNAQYMVHARRNCSGPLKVGLWPHLSYTLLSWAIDRNSSNEVLSKMGELTYPGIETTQHLGLKPNAVTIEGQEEGDIMMSLDLIGWYEQPRAGGIISYPGAYEVPEIPSLQFLNCRFIISLNAGSTGSFTNRIQPVGLNAFRLSYENQLKAGPPIENRFVPRKDAAIQFLITGRKKLGISYTAAFDRQEYQTLQREALYTQFKLIGASRAYTQVATVAADAAAGSNVNIQVDSSTGFLVGDAVFMDAYTTTVAHLPCVGYVSAVPDATHITIDVLDEAVKSGDHIFNGAIEIKTAPAIVPSSPKSKTFGEFVTVEVTGDVFSGSDAILSYKCRDMALPA